MLISYYYFLAVLHIYIFLTYLRGNMNLEPWLHLAKHQNYLGELVKNTGFQITSLFLISSNSLCLRKDRSQRHLSARTACSSMTHKEDWSSEQKVRLTWNVLEDWALRRGDLWRIVLGGMRTWNHLPTASTLLSLNLIAFNHRSFDSFQASLLKGNKIVWACVRVNQVP